MSKAEFLGDKLHQVATVSRKARHIPSEVEFANKIRENGFSSATLTQCNSIASFLKLLYEWDQNPRENFSVYHMVHEHSIPGVIAGIYLGSGEKSVAIFQNSGLSNYGDGVISFAENYGIPLLAISTFRGIGEISRPHQSWAGKTIALARAMMGRKNVFGSALGLNIMESLDKASTDVLGDPENPGQAILLLPKGAIRETREKSAPNSVDTSYHELPLEVRAFKGTDKAEYMESEAISRDEALLEIVNKHPNALIIACNGFTARALLQVKDRPGNFYQAAYMGSGKYLGYGAAISNSNLEVVVIDGDENAQMGNPIYEILAHHYPKNLHCYILNNGGAASVDGAIPSVPLAYYQFDMNHVIKTNMDDLTDFKHVRVEEGVWNMFDEADAEILRRELGELKFITKRVRRFVEQEVPKKVDLSQFIKHLA